MDYTDQMTKGGESHIQEDYFWKGVTCFPPKGRKQEGNEVVSEWGVLTVSGGV